MSLVDDELLRYSRQILLPEVDIAGQLKLKQSSVMLVGVGGLGSLASLYLASAGIGTLVLADFDKVDVSNLQRQVLYSTQQIGQPKVMAAKERLQATNPYCVIETCVEPLSEETIDQWVHRVDVVLDCSDNFLTRELVNKSCVMNKKPLVSGAAIQLQGQLSVFDVRSNVSPCYHCLYGEGLEEELTCSEAGVLGPLVGMIASLQALEAIRLLVGFGEPQVGKLLLFNAFKGQTRHLTIMRDDSCPVCGDRV